MIYIYCYKLYKFVVNIFIRKCRYRFFQQRYDARRRLGFTGLQKCTAAMRLIAYGNTADSVDEYLQMSERTARECLYRFSRGVYHTFRDVYLRGPTEADVKKLYEAHEERHGFPGMLGSLDCTHWDWRNCPTAWKGMYTGGHHGVPSLVLEAVASADLWIWHAYFGVAGSNNDINVLDQSPIFDDMLMGKAPDAPFEVNGNRYKYGYYITDGIYPPYATLVKAKRLAHRPRDEVFTTRQAAARKDVECAFGVMKSKWHIFQHAARPYHLDNLRYIMYAMIIMHNMVIEDQGRHICPYVPTDPRPILYPVGSNEYRHRGVDIHDHNIHNQLHEDLTTHIFYNPRNMEDAGLPVGVAPGVPPVDPFADVPDDELPVDEDDEGLEDYDDVVDDD